MKSIKTFPRGPAKSYFAADIAAASKGHGGDEEADV